MNILKHRNKCMDIVTDFNPPYEFLRRTNIEKTPSTSDG